MEQQFYLDPEQDSMYSEFITISSDEEENFSDGVSVIFSEFEENMMDVGAQLMAQLSTPVAVRGRQMTLEVHDDSPSPNTPLRCGGPYSGFRPRGLGSFSNDPMLGARQKEPHPMVVCGNLIPFVDTPTSPPPHERGFLNTSTNDLFPSYVQPEKVSMSVQTLPSWDIQPPLTPIVPPPTPMMTRISLISRRDSKHPTVLPIVILLIV